MKKNKADLVAAIAERAEVTKAEAGRMVDAFTAFTQETLKDGGEVALIGFGTFKTGERKARTGRNPKTGEEIQIAAGTTVRFTAGKAFKDAVND